MNSATINQNVAPEAKAVQERNPLERVEDDMVACLRERGPDNFLQWIGQWFTRVETAKTLQYLGVNRAAELTESDRAWCLKELLSATQFAANSSSSVGANLQRQARIEVLRELCVGRGLSKVQADVQAALEQK